MRIKRLNEVKKKASKGSQCYYCNRAMTSSKTELYKTNPGLLATFEHVIPQIKNGGNDQDNILIVCARCNGLKGDLNYDVFFPYSNVILKQYPNLPTVFLRRVLNQYIQFLAETAIRNNRSKRVALGAALLHANELSKEL